MNETRRWQKARRCGPWSAPLWAQVLSPVCGRLSRMMSPALLSLLLMSCGSPAPQPVRVVKQRPPPVLLLDCQRPEADLSTNATVIDSLLACNARVVECNLNQAALREWAAE